MLCRNATNHACTIKKILIRSMLKNRLPNLSQSTKNIIIAKMLSECWSMVLCCFQGYLTAIKSLIESAFFGRVTNYSGFAPMENNTINLSWCIATKFVWATKPSLPFEGQDLLPSRRDPCIGIMHISYLPTSQVVHTKILFKEWTNDIINAWCLVAPLRRHYHKFSLLDRSNQCNNKWKKRWWLYKG